MKNQFSLIFALTLGSSLLAQDVIVRQRNGAPSYFYSTAINHTPLVAAFGGAMNGDTIYLPGVTYTLSANVDIAAGVTIIGTGIRQDSAMAAGGRSTIICGGYDIQFAAGSDNSEMHGIVVTSTTNGGVFFGTSNATANRSGMKFKRCSFDHLTLGYTGTNNTLATNNLIEECTITNLKVNNAQYTTVRNSFINTMTYAGGNTLVENCVFLNFNQAANNNNADVIYRSNIFLREVTANYAITEASTFQNNLWVLQTGSTVSWPAAVAQTNNVQTALINDVFVATTSYTAYSFTSNYHLVLGSSYLTAAFDAGQLGVYGSTTPWKDGSLPFNPHWQLFVAPSATVGGTLQNVHLKAAAQTH